MKPVLEEVAVGSCVELGAEETKTVLNQKAASIGLVFIGLFSNFTGMVKRCVKIP